MERTRLQWILWFALIQVLLNLSNAMLNGRKLSTSDFKSIDCGASNEYVDSQTGFSYQTDAGFVETGNNSMVAPDQRFNVDFPFFGRQLQTLRSFPEGRRNCYTLKPKQGRNQQYLIRAFFAYGNYDRKNQTPSFDLYLGTNHWASIYPARLYHFEEIIHTPPSDTIHVCLVNSGEGVPFISSLELRPLSNSIYTTHFPSQSLLDLDTRIDVGYNSKVTHSRYMDDIYDRMWRKDDYNLQDWHAFDKSLDINPERINYSYRLPAQVLSSASKTLNRSSALNFNCLSAWRTPFENSFTYYIYFHFAEIEQLPFGQKRVIDITVNGENILPKPITLEYLKPQTISAVTNQSCIRFSISATSESAAPPIINAYEIYKLISPLTFPTDQRDVDAILDIKIKYKISKLDWQGEPCFPNYAWEGLICSSATNHSYARITSLNLSSSKLTGDIAISFSQLTELESLDLSDNHLSGTIPEFLAELPKLRVLNLQGNKLTGSIPKALMEKKSDFEMSLDGNPDLCLTDTCKKHKFVIPLIASVSAFIIVILVSLGIWIFRIKRLKGDFARHESSKIINRAFSYSNVLEITNNLQNLIGEGGFGKVYLGTLKNGTQVAVKLLSQSSVQGHREFQSEVELLMVVHHRNLVSLIGYCEDTGARALVYEYMANGDLRRHVSGDNGDALKWKKRIQIALGAACGLEYLHNGCKPAIVHRDLKTTNILLDENMEAKKDMRLRSGRVRERRSDLKFVPFSVLTPMGDSGARSTSPVRVLEPVLVTGRGKKSKTGNVDVSSRADRRAVAIDPPEADVGKKMDTISRMAGIGISYKESLLGFKGSEFDGVAYGCVSGEEDLNITDLVDQSWNIPEPSEALTQLKEIYPTLHMTQDEYNRWAKPWNNALIITTLGTRLNCYRLKEHLIRIWNINCFELIDLPNNYYVVKFKDPVSWENHFRKVLFDGPWMVAQHSILVQRWSPYFDPFCNPLGRVASWVRIPHVPLLFYNKECMWRLGDMIGKTIKVDLNSIANLEDEETNIRRGRYARICVELDLQKKLIPRIISADALFNIEYEGLDLICFSCGRYGHRKEKCQWSLLQEDASTVEVSGQGKGAVLKMPSENHIPGKEDQFGPWMFVHKPSKFRRPRKEVGRSRVGVRGQPRFAEGKADGVATQSRFDALVDSDQDVGEDLEMFMNAVSKKGDVEVEEGKHIAQEMLSAKDKDLVRRNKKKMAGGNKWDVVLGNIKPISLGQKAKIHALGVDLNKEKVLGSQKGDKEKLGGSLRVHRIVRGSLENNGPCEAKKQIVVEKVDVSRGVGNKNSLLNSNGKGIDSNSEFSIKNSEIVLNPLNHVESSLDQQGTVSLMHPTSQLVVEVLLDSEPPDG